MLFGLDHFRPGCGPRRVRPCRMHTESGRKIMGVYRELLRRVSGRQRPQHHRRRFEFGEPIGATLSCEIVAPPLLYIPVLIDVRRGPRRLDRQPKTGTAIKAPCPHKFGPMDATQSMSASPGKREFVAQQRNHAMCPQGDSWAVHNCRRGLVRVSAKLVLPHRATASGPCRGFRSSHYHKAAIEIHSPRLFTECRAQWPVQQADALIF